MNNKIIPLRDIGTLSHQKANQLFTIPTKYDHILNLDDSGFEPEIVWIKFDDIRSLDDDQNIGRTEPHTEDQIQQISNSFSKGVETWQELPCVTRNDVNSYKFKYDQVYGYGRVRAIQEAGMKDGYWFTVVKGNDYELGWIKVTENLDLSPSFKQGKHLLVQQMNRLIKNGLLANDENKIRDEITKINPTISKKLLGDVATTIFATQGTPERYQTWGPVKIKQWLRQSAAVEFMIGGHYDTKRKKFGYANKNVLDPLTQAILKYAETGSKSYAVLHVNAPNNQGDLKTLRKAQLETLDRYISAYKAVGMSEFPLEILGFMPQDSHGEKPMYLVDVNGNKV